MIKAAFTLAFAAFLRGSEFTTSGTFQPTTNATIDDITDLDHKTFKFHIKLSKTDQFHKGQVVKLSATGDPLCPVSAMYNYIQGSQESTYISFQKQSTYMYVNEGSTTHLMLASSPTELSIETIQHTQFSNWSSHFSSSLRNVHKRNQKTRPLEKSCLPWLHQDMYLNRVLSITCNDYI